MARVAEGPSRSSKLARIAFELFPMFTSFRRGHVTHFGVEVQHRIEQVSMAVYFPSVFPIASASIWEGYSQHFPISHGRV